MKKLIVLLLIAVSFFNCSENKKTIDFVKLKPSEFNAKQFEIPTGSLIDSLKQVHDSCMGFSFNANVMLGRNSNFFIGNIVNKNSFEIVNSLNNLGLNPPQLIGKFNILSNPCYEKHVLNFPLRSILGENFMLQFPGVDETVNKEINDAVNEANNAEMQAGSWIYLDLKSVLKNLIDTVKSVEGLRYKNNLLDTSNIVLTAVESVTDVSFMIDTKKGISTPLQAFLKTKPSLPSPDDRSSTQLFYIDAYVFKITINGFFPVVGEFTKAELK